MRISTSFLAFVYCLSAALASPLVNDVSIAAPEPCHVGEHYALLHRDLPDVFHADNNTHLPTEEYQRKLSARGCYANGYFSILFNAGGNNCLNLFGKGQPEQGHGLICSTAYSGFNSWLPFVFMARSGLCCVGVLTRCCNSYNEIFSQVLVLYHETHWGSTLRKYWRECWKVHLPYQSPGLRIPDESSPAFLESHGHNSG